jgi:hypothetical protein
MIIYDNNLIRKRWNFATNPDSNKMWNERSKQKELYSSKDAEVVKLLANMGIEPTNMEI